MELYHVTTPKKAKKYRATGYIIAPVRGFDSLQAASAWAMKTGRTVIYKIETQNDKTYKLPDHHNKFGCAFWTEENISNMKCVISPGKV